MDEAVVEGFQRGVTNHFYLRRAQLREFSFKRSLGYFRDGNGAVSFGIIAIGSAWGKLDEAHSLESKQDFSCGHVFEVSVGLVPLPFAT
jgi:hypothetical protein